MTPRIVEPELLDELPSSDPAARRSRRDLRRLNWLMGHPALLAQALRASPAVKRICDLGSGDGHVMLQVARKLRWRDVRLTLVDRQNTMSAETERAFAEFGWRVTYMEADVFAVLREAPRFDAITANLFLHHFREESLRELLDLAGSKTWFFVACEPRRSALALAASRSLALLGCNAVTRHDAVKSVRAGFAATDLSGYWPASKSWSRIERRAGLFSHLFVAQRA